jgi:hypothetical protein
MKLLYKAKKPLSLGMGPDLAQTRLQVVFDWHLPFVGGRWYYRKDGPQSVLIIFLYPFPCVYAHITVSYFRGGRYAKSN